MRNVRPATRLLPLLLAGALLAASPRTSRADSAVAEAMALFNEGVRLRDAGKRTEACALFAESLRLESTAGRLLNVADCHEQEGKWATAWAEFLSASHLYKIRNDDDAVIECQRRASLLEPRLSRLTLRIAQPTTSLVVRRNGRVIRAAQFGLPLPVDPGEYVVTAEAPGCAPFRAFVRVGSARNDQTIRVPALLARPPETAIEGRRAAGYVAGGLGIAALGVGATFGAMALTSNAKVEDACPSSHQCEHGAAIAARDRATTQAWVANVGVGLGLAGLAAGGYLLFLMPRGRKVGTSAGQYEGVMFLPQPGGLRVAVRFLKRGVEMSALKKGGPFRTRFKRSHGISIVNLCSLIAMLGCQVIGGFDDVPTPSCPPGTVQAGDVIPDACVSEVGGASGYAGAAAASGGSGPMQGAAGTDNSPLCQKAKNWETNSLLTGTPFAGGDYTCAISTIHDDDDYDGEYSEESARLACWGRNNLGQTAQNTNFGTNAPSPVPTIFEEDACVFSTFTAESDATSHISLGQFHGCATLNYINYRAGSTPINGLFCWGDDSRGQLGRGTLLYKTMGTPYERIGWVLEFLPGGIADLATGRQHSCAMMHDGGAYCWGSNEFGQLGAGAEANFGTQERNEEATPVKAKDGNLLSSARAMAGGGDHNCVITVDRQVWCWGKNNFGQLGRGEAGSSTTPDYVAAPVVGPGGGLLRNAIQIALGGDHSCAITEDPEGGGRTLLCWGGNKFGQLGRATNAGTEEPNPTPAPVVVPAYYQFNDLHDVALGGAHTCALAGADADVFCWGSNAHGQLGRAENFETDLPNAAPMPIDDPFLDYSRQMALALGNSHTCAVSEGSLVIKCWGNNQFGQLGAETLGSDGSLSFSHTPKSNIIASPFFRPFPEDGD